MQHLCYLLEVASHEPISYYAAVSCETEIVLSFCSKTPLPCSAQQCDITSSFGVKCKANFVELKSNAAITMKAMYAWYSKHVLLQWFPTGLWGMKFPSGHGPEVQ